MILQAKCHVVYITIQVQPVASFSCEEQTLFVVYLTPRKDRQSSVMLAPSLLQTMQINRRNRLSSPQHRHDIPHTQLLEPFMRLNRPSSIVTCQHGLRPRHLEQPRMRPRLVGMHVQRNSPNLPRLQRVRQSLLVNQTTPRDIHKPRPSFKPSQRLRSNNLATSRRAQHNAVRDT